MRNKTAELLITKLCHDLSGPIGAVNNGMELLKDSNESIKERSLELIEISADETIKKLLFFRKAYGTIKHNTTENFDETIKTCKEFLELKKINLIWELEPNNVEGKNINEISHAIINLIIAAMQCVISSGEIIVKSADSNQVEIITQSPYLKIPDNFENIFSGKLTEDQKNVENISIFNAKDILESLNMQLDISHDGNSVTMKISV